MLLGALLDAGADVERVRAVIASLGVPGLGLRTEPARRGGLACLRAVITTPTVADRERHLADVLGHVGDSDLHPAGKDFATRVFRLLAEAEGAVHGEPPEDVHFHEVGAFDSMADVVGSAAALEDLGLLRPGAVVCCSALAAGSGFVNSRHGRLPVPAPAVLRIAAAAGLDLASGDLTGERTTPTGAALLAAVAVPGGFPAMTVRAVGTGGGGRDTPDRPNITRVVVGAASAAATGPARGRGDRGREHGGRPRPPAVALRPAGGAGGRRLGLLVHPDHRTARPPGAGPHRPVRRTGPPGRGRRDLRPDRDPRRPLVPDEPADRRPYVGAGGGGTAGPPPGRHGQGGRHPQGPPVTPGVTGTPDAGGTPGAAGITGPEDYGTATAELAEAEAAAQALGWPVRAVCEAAVAQYRAQVRQAP